MSSTKFLTFTEMKIHNIGKLAATLFSKSCVLDPLPPSFIKPCIDLLLPTIINLVNLCSRWLHAYVSEICSIVTSAQET